MVAEQPFEVCRTCADDEIHVAEEIGLSQFVEQVRSGIYRLGDRKLLICTLGRADILAGQRFSIVAERFIKMCKEMFLELWIIVTGPFPNAADNPRSILSMSIARRYLEERLASENHFRFCRVAERYGDSRGLVYRLINRHGFTVRGAEVLHKDLQDVTYAVRKSWQC